MSESNKEHESTVKAELDELREEAKNYSASEIKDGGWFVRFLSYALRNYAEQVDAEYFKRKYPNLPPDAIVDRLIQLAQRYSAIEGGLTASAYSGAIALTIGSHGGASPVTLPAALASFTVDLFYVTRLQLRLAYDLSVLYGFKIDLDDSEDVYDLLRVAFGIKAGEALRSGIAKLAPEATRQGVKYVAKGATLAWLRALPVVGKYLLQRNIIKFAIPVISIPISAGFNHYSTGAIARMARQIYRDKAAIRERSRKDAVAGAADPLLMLQVVYLAAKSDGSVQAEESWLLNDLTRAFCEHEDGVEAVAGFQEAIELDQGEVLRRVVDAPPEMRDGLYEAAVYAVAVDHKVRRKELAFLRQLAPACGRVFDEKAIKAAVR